MKLGVVVALWKRPRLTALCLRQIARHAPEGTILAAATDEPDNARAARDAGWWVTHAPNHPVGAKHNAVAQALRGKVDAIVVTGSDNWLCPRLLARWRELLVDRPVVGVLDAWQVSLYHDEGAYFGGYQSPRRRGESVGVARGLRADVLDRLDWAPWDGALDRNLDYSMRGKLEAIGLFPAGELQADLGVRTLGLKGARALTPFGAFRRLPGAKAVSADEALAPFHPDDVAAFRVLQATLRAERDRRALSSPR